MNSPFEYKVVDGDIVRIKRADGETFGKVEGTDLNGLCELISALDEQLWSVRKSFTEVEKDLRGKIKLAKEALES